MDSNFWQDQVIDAYTRTEAIRDGILVDLMQGETDAACKSYKWPITCTAAVWQLIESR